MGPGIRKTRNETHKEIPCKSMDFHTLSSIQPKQSRERSMFVLLIYTEIKKYMSMNEYKNKVKLKQFVNLNKVKIKQPLRNVLRNVSINKALNNKFTQFKSIKVKYPTMVDSGVYNDSTSLGISNIFSHRPLV